MSRKLPKGFEALEPFIAIWSANTAAQRDNLRTTVPAQQRAAFHRVIAPLANQALDQLDEKGLANFDAADENLMQLLLAYAHVGHAEEVQGSDEAKHAATRPRLRFTRAPADRATNADSLP
ncbi:hypothetical protein [Pontixanthobacter aquaemixtae]|uniref:Uncharacterized protein n=1 Tax=Pontixanthobacter aquaemixtae TaxID=1958940 RepID=A0A844ZQ54_9SPHN|nr:hypothetical protein [Pontixanthobacter aquaemixtae]MXO89985.1 hypothetical protein [Pontixanthobacter aquaemixtae]